MWAEGFCAKCPPDSFGEFATEIISTGYSVYVHASVIFDYVICICICILKMKSREESKGCISR